MKIDALKLTNFRNIASLELQPVERVNIIYGNNAQGKTNLIEALWLLTGAKSFRGAKDAELLLFGSDYAKIEADFYKEGRVQTAQILFAAKKQAQLNEINLSSVTGLAGIFCAVVFSPSHLGLIQDGPSARRRFADTCICQISPKFIALMSDYNRTLLQRNSLLKDISYSAYLLDTLDVWDDRLAALSALIVKNRKQYLQRLAVHAGEIYSGISSEKETLHMRYAASAGLTDDIPAEQYKQWFLQALAKARAEDIKTGCTSVGPHRDDIDFEINGVDVRSFGSQGQQRSSVLALKLAESRLISELLHDEPIILLDDVMSELDKNRQDYLLNHLSGNQVFITCCDKACFDNLQNGKAFHMVNGGLQNTQS